MIRRVAIVMLSAACLGSFLLGISIRCHWTGFCWVIHDDQHKAIEPAEHIVLLGSHPGTLTICYNQLVKQVPRRRKIDLGIVKVKISDFSIHYAGGWRKETWRSTHISIPFWVISLLLGMWPAIAFIRGPYRRYRRRKKGLCLTCGYNLTGNVSGVCPECGEKL